MSPAASATSPVGATPEPDRVTIVAEWLLAGMRPSQIPAHAAGKGWTLTPSDLQDLIAQAQDQIDLDSRLDVNRENAKAVARLNHLFARSLAIQDYKTALSVQKEINTVVARVSDPLAQPPPADQPETPKPPKSRRGRK